MAVYFLLKGVLEEISYLFGKIQRIDGFDAKVVNSKHSVFLFIWPHFQNDSTGYLEGIADDKDLRDGSSDFKFI